jgi:hypothetical protein
MFRPWACALMIGWLAGCGGGGGAAGGSTAGAGTQQAPSTSAVSGVVNDAAGQPVAGVVVSVFHHNTHVTITATTDAAGRYQVAGLDNVSNADYAVYADRTGLAFSPSASDAAAEVTRMDFNGQYRTVVRLAALPARDVAGVNFTALRATDRLVSLQATGQQQTLAPGDDGAWRRGQAWPAPRWVDGGDGTVQDRLTGLVWLKDAGCLPADRWAQALAAVAQLAPGRCGLSDGSSAGQWRLPNVNELESLVDASQAGPALPLGQTFQRVRQDVPYWSSTTYTAVPTQAMAIRFSDGRWINGIDSGDAGLSNVKTVASNGVWAVRSGAPGAVQLLATGVYDGVGGPAALPGDDASLHKGVALPGNRFVDGGDGTVTDTATGLVWLKLANCIRQNWTDALAAVQVLADGQCGLSDHSRAGQWRLPNRAEMLSLSDRAPTFPQASYLNGQYQGTATVNGPVIFGQMVVGDYYWTSTTSAADISQAWGVYSCDFGVYNLDKASVHVALAVR